MSNHVYLMCNSPEGKLSDTIRDLKKFTSRKIIEAIETGNESRREWMLDRFGFLGRTNSRNQDYQVWTHEIHALVLYTPLERICIVCLIKRQWYRKIIKANARHSAGHCCFKVLKFKFTFGNKGINQFFYNLLVLIRHKINRIKPGYRDYRFIQVYPLTVLLILCRKCCPFQIYHRSWAGKQCYR